MAADHREDTGRAGRGLRGRARRSATARGVLEITAANIPADPLEALRRAAQRLDGAPCTCPGQRAAMAAAPAKSAK
jgi:hypothetical protein